MPGSERPRRSDAQRSAAAVLDAAVSVLGRSPDASMEQIAAAAGVTRPTIYAHFGSREGLVAAVLDRVTDEALVAIEAAALDEGPAADALVRFIDATWEVFERTPALLHLAGEPTDAAADAARHEPVTEHLTRLIRRGQRSREFDPGLPASWLVTATIALGHAAWEAVADERMDLQTAAPVLRRSVLALYGAGGGTPR